MDRWIDGWIYVGGWWMGGWRGRREGHRWEKAAPGLPTFP